MNKRLKYLREEILLLSQEEFANRVGRKNDIISIYENGKKPISKKFIKLVCDEYNINQEWLETGKGPIFKEMTEIEQMKKKIDEVMESKSEFQRNALYVLATMSEEEWDLIEKMYYKIKQHSKDKADL